MRRESVRRRSVKGGGVGEKLAEMKRAVKERESES